MSQVSLRRESAEAEWQTNIVYNYSFLPTSAFSCRAEPATPLLSECCLIKSLRPLRPLRAEKIHPCDGYISHAKSAENADSFLSLTQKYNSPARTDSFFSLTQNSPNTQIFLSARVGLRWRWSSRSLRATENAKASELSTPSVASLLVPPVSGGQSVTTG